MKTVLLSTLLFFINFSVFSQEADTLKAHSYFAKADSFLTQAKYDSSLFWFNLAAKEYKQAARWEDHFLSIGKAARSFRKMRKYDEAWELAKKIVSESIQTLGINNLGEAYAYCVMGNIKVYGESDLEKGIEFYDKAIEIQKSTENGLLYLSFSYTAKGLVLSTKGNSISAMEAFQKAFDIQNELFGDDHLYTAGGYNNLGMVFLQTGSYELASEHFQRALTIFKEKVGQKHPYILYSINNIGLTHWQRGDLNLALNYFEKALSLNEEIFNEKNLNSAVYFNNLGIIHKELGHYRLAIEYEEAALKIRQEKLSENDPLLADTYNNLSEIYLQKREYDLALSFSLKALKIRKETFGDSSPYVSESYNSLGDIFIRKKDIKKGIEYIQKAIAANDSTFTSYSNIYENPKLKDYYSPIHLLRSLSLKAEAMTLMNGLKNKNFSIETYKLFSKLTNDLRRKQLVESDQVVQTELARTTLKKAVETTVNHYFETQDQKYLHAAFAFVEENKASILYEQISRLNGQKFLNIPDSLLSKERELKIDLAFYKSKELFEIMKEDGYDTITLVQIREKIFRIKREKEKLTTSLEKEFPKYYELKYHTEKVTVLEVQQELDHNTTIVEYFIGDSAIFAFKITQNQFEVERLSKIDSLTLKIENLYKSLKVNDFNTYSSLAIEFHDKLIAPLKILKPKLTIVPDGTLWYLNFDLLLTEKTKKKDFSLCKYLIKTHTINYVNSINLLTVDNKSLSSNSACLAFSYNNSQDVNTGSSMQFRDISKKDLPGTRQEIRSISEIIDGEYFYGSFASEKNFKMKAKDFGILHLALHGEIDNENPMNSKLLFSQSKDSIEDNNLHAFELYNTELNADLVVLSACNTGTGKLANGEGIMSMGRAFAYAGAKSLIISQWELSDNITPTLMTSFYMNITNGKPKSEALREAKLTYLSTSDNLSANPYYWASLVQIGNDSSIYSRRSNNRITLGLVAIILVLFLTLYKKKR
ncbi:MAG: CHAT domain-containing tetratricopeptide repeat protein [Ekhidna sp.]